MDKPRGPRAVAEALEVGIAELERQRAVVPKAERPPINQRIHRMKALLRWCKTRPGYRPKTWHYRDFRN